MAEGMFIFKGMKIGVLAGDLTISDDASNSNLILSTAYNVIPVWLRSASDSCKQAKIASQNIRENWTQNEENRAELLISEIGPCLQTIVACGISLDALYEMLKPHAKITSKDIEEWKNNKTARHKQISEVVRRCFKLNGEILKDFKKAITEVIKLRDLAVHPSLELKNACSRPDIPVGVDWKFSMYTFMNAERCLKSTVHMIVYLYEHKSGMQIVDESISNIIDDLLELKILKPNA